MILAQEKGPEYSLSARCPAGYDALEGTTMHKRQFGSCLPAAAGISLFAILAVPGCFTYSSYQSARIVERGEPQVTFAVSSSGFLEGEENEDATWYAFETCLRGGLAQRVDGAVTLSIFSNVPELWGAAVVTVDLRAGIAKDYLAAVLPVSVTVGDSYLASLRMQPGLVGTLPIGSRLEITGAARAHVFVRATDLFALGYNVGLGIRDDSGKWVLRPEVGWMVFRDEVDFDRPTYFQYGIGLEFGSPKPKTGQKRDP